MGDSSNSASLHGRSLARAAGVKAGRQVCIGMTAVKSSIYGFLGLEESPFSPGTSRLDYFKTIQSTQILREFCYGITSRKGFLLLLGEVGVGKTSLLLQLLEHLQNEPGLESAWVFNTALNPKDLLSAIIADSGLSVSREATLAEMIEVLHTHFLQVNESGGNCAIIVDEAHHLSVETLEALRMLSNLESNGQKLVQIILAGQPELDTTLNRPDLRQLRSRICIHRTLQPLGRQELRQYCAFKLSTCKGRIDLSNRSFRLIWSATRGNLRMIHLVMDRALHGMVVHQSFSITPTILKEVFNELAAFHADIRRRIAAMRGRRAGFSLACCILVLIAVQRINGFDLQKTSLASLIPSSLVSSQAKTVTSRPMPKDALPDGSGAGDWTPEGESPRPFRDLADSRDGGQLEPPSRSNGTNELQKGSSFQDVATLTAFLQPFGLNKLLPALRRAVQQGEASLLEPDLPSGYEIVETDWLPESSHIQWASLPWRQVTGNQPKWLILWRPPLQICAQGPAVSDRMDVIILQRMLQELGYYHGQLDGMYGSKTHQAIQRFQVATGLGGGSGIKPGLVLKLCVDFARLNAGESG